MEKILRFDPSKEVGIPVTIKDILLPKIISVKVVIPAGQPQLYLIDGKWLVSKGEIEISLRKWRDEQKQISRVPAPSGSLEELWESLGRSGTSEFILAFNEAYP